MKPRIILSTGSVYTYSTDRAFEFAKKAGYDGIELIIDNRFKTRQAEHIKKLEKRYKIKVISVHSAMEFVTVWGEDPKVRLKRSIELAKQLKAKRLVVHPTIANNKPFYKWAFSNRKKIEKSALPVQVVFENLTKGIDVLEGQDLVFENFDYKQFSRFENIILDTSHLATTGQDIVEVAQKLGDKIKQVHFSDSDFAMHPERINSIADRHMIPGEGKLPLKEFLKTLKDNKFKGIITVELGPEATHAGESDRVVLARIKKALKFVRSNSR